MNYSANSETQTMRQLRSPGLAGVREGTTNTQRNDPLQRRGNSKYPADRNLYTAPKIVQGAAAGHHWEEHDPLPASRLGP